MGEVEDYIRSELTRLLKEELEKGPWWCIICGEGGNYEGQRPELYWIPPEDHVCNVPPPDFTEGSRRSRTYQQET